MIQVLEEYISVNTCDLGLVKSGCEVVGARYTVVRLGWCELEMKYAWSWETEYTKGQWLDTILK